MLKKNFKPNVLFLGQKIPSYILGVKLPVIFSKGLSIKFNPYYHTDFWRPISEKKIFNLLWIVRRCDFQTIDYTLQAKSKGLPVLYEFDDRFDLLPANDDYHTSIGIIACFYWMLVKSDALKTYMTDIVNDFPDYLRSKLHFGKQYTPVHSNLSSLQLRWHSDEIRIGILATIISSPDLCARYNNVIKLIKNNSNKRIIFYGFDKNLNLDIYIKQGLTTEKYLKIIDSYKLHFCIVISELFNWGTGKTPNKFREAAGFGYICAAINNLQFNTIPDDLMLKCSTDNDLVFSIINLINKPDESIRIIKNAYSYSLINFNINDVLEEITKNVTNYSSKNGVKLFSHRYLNKFSTFKIADNCKNTDLHNIVRGIFTYFGFLEISDNRCDILVGDKFSKISNNSYFLSINGSLSNNEIVEVNFQRITPHLPLKIHNLFNKTISDKFSFNAAIIDIIIINRIGIYNNYKSFVKYFLKKIRNFFIRIIYLK